ncbi:hypothetical protein ACWEJ6_21125 [Nonomuraea sp. NPDC004702]
MADDYSGLRLLSEERLAEATKDHWELCGCSWCWELLRRKAEASQEVEG